VSTEEGKEFAQREGLLFMETSANNKDNVDLAFAEIVKTIFYKVHKEIQPDDAWGSNDGPMESKPVNLLLDKKEEGRSFLCCKM